MRPIESVTRYGLEPATNDFPRAGEITEGERELPPTFPSSPSPLELARVDRTMIGYQVPDMNESGAIGKVKAQIPGSYRSQRRNSPANTVTPS